MTSTNFFGSFSLVTVKLAHPISTIVCLWNPFSHCRRHLWTVPMGRSCTFRKNYSSRKVCTTCGKMVHYQHWALHQRGHRRAEGNADELYHYCDQCDKRFYSKQYLQRHIREGPFIDDVRKLFNPNPSPCSDLRLSCSIV